MTGTILPLAATALEVPLDKCLKQVLPIPAATVDNLVPAAAMTPPDSYSTIACVTPPSEAGYATAGRWTVRTANDGGTRMRTTQARAILCSKNLRTPPTFHRRSIGSVRPWDATVSTPCLGTEAWASSTGRTTRGSIARSR